MSRELKNNNFKKTKEEFVVKNLRVNIFALLFLIHLF